MSTTTETIETTRQPIADETLRHARANVWSGEAVEWYTISLADSDATLVKPVHLITDEEALRIYKHAGRPVDVWEDDDMIDEYDWLVEHGWVLSSGWEDSFDTTGGAVEGLQWYLSKFDE